MGHKNKKAPAYQCFGLLLWGVLLTLSARAEPWWATITDPALRQCVAEMAAQRSWSTATQADELICHNKGIRELTGLPVLPALRKLSLFNNQLQTIDLQRWPALQHLNVARNQLQQLHLHELPQLQELLCFDNKLKKLQLLNLPQLVLLKGNANALTQFDYRDLPRLEKIYLFNNKMTTIDIDHLPSLRYMDVRQNPMPDELYQRMDQQKNVTYLHDGNAPDWK